MENGNKEILKVCILDSNNSPRHLLVFGSDREHSLFSNIETAFYKAQNTNIIYTDTKIYLDDTIQTANHKIWNACKENDKIPMFCLEEMYLFSVIETPFQLLPWYKEITNYEKEELTNKTVAKLLTNYYLDKELDVDLLLKNDSFQDDLHPEISFEDLENLDVFREKTKLEKMGLGFEFNFQTPPNLRNRDAYFCVNPFESEFFKDLHVHPSDQIQQPNHFLFHKGNFKDNTIYLCLAEDVVEYWDRNEIPHEKLTEQYYPILPKDFWSSGREDNLKRNQEMVDQPHLLLQNKYIDAIIGMQKEPELDYISRGIKSFYFIKHPYETKNLPILTIFKRIATSIDVPIIQFSSPNKENSISRIHTKQKTHEGIKIPLLNHLMTNETHLKDLKQGSREERLVLFIHYDNKIRPDPDTNPMNDLIRLSLEKNGNIHIQGNMNTFIDIGIFETYINKILDPAINMLNIAVIPLGYRLEPFETIDHPYVETVFLNFGCEIDMVTNTLNSSTETVSNCLSSIFIPRLQPAKKANKANKAKNPKKPGKPKDMEMIYWRVENYEKLTDEDIYISQLLRLNYNRVFKRQQIEAELTARFPGKQADLLLIDYEDRQGQRITPSRYTNQDKSQKTNSGFLTTINRIDSFSYKYRVEVRFIHNMSYLKTVPVFIDSMLKMIMKPTDEITQICSSGKRVEVDMFEQPIANDIPLVEADSEILNNENNDPDDIKSNVSDDEEEEEDDEKSLVDNKGEQNEEEEEEEEIEDVAKEDPDAGLLLFDDDDEDVVEEDPDAGLLLFDDDGENKEEEEEFGGGAKKKKLGEWTAPLDYYLARIKDRDPVLRQQMEDGNYARKSQQERPIVLTEEEKLIVDAKISDQTQDYGDKKQYESVKFRKDKNGKFLHYICPKYWCARAGEEGPLTEKEAKSGKCGKMITKKGKRQADEFVMVNDINGNGNMMMGFLNANEKTEKVDSGNVPICFPQCLKIRGPKQIALRSRCNPEAYPASRASKMTPKPKNKKEAEKKTTDLEEEEEDDYGDDDDDDDEKEDAEEDDEGEKNEEDDNDSPHEMPIKDVSFFINMTKMRTLVDTAVSKDRLGRLPPAIQIFLNSKYTKDKLVVGGEKVLLRFGLTQTKNNLHSFLACLADIYSLIQPKYVESDAFRKVLVEKVTLDAYVSLHSGSIASIFQPTIERKIDIEKYRDTELYKYIDQAEESQLAFLQSSIASLENFHAYLLDEENVIEPTYLWEIINGKLLFGNGYNMIIVEHFSSNGQVGIQCPNNSYINNIFNPEKYTFILLKQKDAYTPLYLIRCEGHTPNRTTGTIESFHLTKVFIRNDGDPNMNALLKMFERNINAYCPPRPGVGITFKRGIDASTTISLLSRFKNTLNIVSAVWNYQGKIIGFTVKWTKQIETNVEGKEEASPKNNVFFLPCYPSTVLRKFYPVKWVDDQSIWKDYKSTVEFLKHVQRIGIESKININCEPNTKVIEGVNVIGIITSSHNFIQINPKIKKSDIERTDTLTNLIHSSNPLESDKNIALNKPSVLQNRNHKLLWLQQQFYTLFRNKIRILLNTFSKTRNIRKEIISMIQQKRTSTKDKMETILEKLKLIGKPHFSFSAYTDDELMKLKKVSLCDGSCDTTPYCVKNDDGVCVLKIPSNNLITNENNETMYIRLTEELMNNKTSFNFMLYNNFYLDYDTQDYIHINDEVILPYSKLNAKYFRSLVPRKDSGYVDKNNYLTTNGKPPVEAVLDWKTQFTRND